MDEVIRKSDWILPPRAGLVFARAASTTAASLDVSAYPGRFLTVKSEGGKIYFLVAPTQGVAEALSASAVSGATQCWPIADGGIEHYVLSDVDNFVGFRTASGTATARFYISSYRTAGETTP